VTPKYKSVYFMMKCISKKKNVVIVYLFKKYNFEDYLKNLTNITC